MANILFFLFKTFSNLNIFEASRGVAAQNVTVKPTGCGFDFSRDEIFTLYFDFFALVSRQSAALNSAT